MFKNAIKIKFIDSQQISGAIKKKKSFSHINIKTRNLWQFAHNDIHIMKTVNAMKQLELFRANLQTLLF